jgi:hypothetical protein
MSRQQNFVAALLDPQRDCPPELTSWNGSDPSSRFAVYRNNVMSSLVNALADSFPVVHQLVGDEFFRAMAQVYVAATPPRSRILSEYGEAFPTFIASFPPASNLPYLADVARLEFLRIQAYHAADTPALSNEQIGAVLAQPDRLDSMTFELHPSVAVLSSAFAIVSLWAAHQGEMSIAQVDPLRAEHALILRNRLDVEVMGIRPGAALFIQALQTGSSFGAAAERALAVDPEFDLSQHLAHLIGTGALTGFRFAP